MPDTLLAALVGAGGALIGTVAGAITTFLVQKRLIAAQASKEIRRDSLARQLVALQELNLAIDFAYGNVGSIAGGPVGDLFVAIVRDSPRHLAFLPADIRADARSLLFEYFKGARSGNITIDDVATKSLQARVLGHIDRVFTEYSTDGR